MNKKLRFSCCCLVFISSVCVVAGNNKEEEGEGTYKIFPGISLLLLLFRILLFVSPFFSSRYAYLLSTPSIYGQERGGGKRGGGWI